MDGRNRPEATVIISCFNQEETLPKALASLRAQSARDWECIVVDDGSDSPTAPLVEAFGDPRFRTIRFSRHRGRPIARQAALERARGEHICFLEAQDWYYPDKLERQLEMLSRHPELAAVSSGLAIVDEEGDLTGVRSVRPFSHMEIGRPPTPPMMAFAPVMLRREHARAVAFDPRLKRAEDRDYLMRVLDGLLYAVLPRPLYAHREFFCPQAVEEALKTLRYQRRFLAPYLLNRPKEALGQFGLSLLRSGLLLGAQRLQRGEWLFARRNEKPSPAQRDRFLFARREVARILQDYRTPSISRAAR